MERIRVYVGSDQRQGRAERVLEYSIRKHTSAEVDIHFMRSGEGEFADWQKGRSEDQPEWRRGRWPTNFSNFRLAVAELAGFEGWAIYLDSDMLVTGDIKELYRIRRGPYTTYSRKRSEVAVIDCAKMKGKVPSLAELKRSGKSLRHYREGLWQRKVLVEGVPDVWNSCDHVMPDMRLLHFTNMNTQPWKPWPERFNYPRKHPDDAVQRMWDQYEAEAKEHAQAG